MRVLLVSHHYPPDAIGGVERITQALASELVEFGDTVTIATRRFGPESFPYTISEPSAKGIPVYRLTGGYFSNETFLQYHQPLEELFGQVLDQVAPDVVHILHLRGLSPRFIELARARGAGVILSLQDFYFACPRITLLNTRGEWCAGPNGGVTCVQTCYADEGTLAHRWEWRAQYWQNLLAQANRIICPSEYMARFFENHGAEASRVHIIPNGVSLAPATLWSDYVYRNQAAGLKLLYLGYVLPHKGLHLILDALEIENIGVVDLVVGGSIADNAYAQTLRERAAKIPGLRLRFYGAYEINELPMLLSGADCVITPSAWPEAFGIVTREALRQGVPAIVSRVGGLAEAVAEGVNGFTFAPDHPQELAAILKRLATEEGLLSRLRAGTRATPIMTNTEHAQAVRAVYAQAQQDALANPFSLDPNLNVQFNALLAAGFDGAIRQ